ncbi:MAG: tetratricopeptide repeat protein [Deltaproteobacteria bacterium]|nr:tetratricopeptide repeat protein [Deltaproteobacteria bacterium]MBW1952422.1 tetratricopeptide repeat protein [Deltaproteobacteria bacterium]MBW1986665.1 tetratricopeptide repeat protein [Deltaproteobacteria bacterium]MBW2134873.1 tetratricopeptide repeat protein [Deltaproteobacteria bacterium]
MLWLVAVGADGQASLSWASEAGEIFLARGTKFYLDGKYREAREQLLEADAVDPQNAEVKLLLGITSFALRDYPQARVALTEALNINPQVPRGKLYLGATLYYLGQYDEARRWLEDAKAETPQEGLVHYYLGLCAYQKNRPEVALSALTTGYGLAPEYAPAFRVYEMALSAPRREPERPFDLTLYTGIEYDDNVKVLPDQTVLPFMKTAKHKADWRIPIMARGEYRPIRTDNMVMGLRYTGYYGINMNLDQFNFFDNLAEIYLRYYRGRLMIEPSYGYNLTFWHEERFSQFHNAGLRLSLIETPILTGDLTYLFQDRSFRYTVTPDYKRSGYLHQVGLYQTLALGAKGAWRVGGIWERELADGVNWSGHTYRVLTELSYMFPYQILAWVSFEYGRTNCDNNDTFFGYRRHDNYYEVIFQLRRPVTDYLDVIAGYIHVSQQSNIPDFEYDRNIYQILMSMSF